MSLEAISSPGGETGAACSLSSLLALGCRSRAEAAHSFAKKLHTKLWSLSPLSNLDGLSTTNQQGAECSEENTTSSWAVAETRFDLNSKRVETVVTSVPLITANLVNNGYQLPPGRQSHQSSPDQSPTELGAVGMEHKHADYQSKMKDNWSHYKKSREGQPASVVNHDQESDTSSTTTTNPMSDSDQYFDFGIETPLDTDSAGEETVSHDLPIVINHDDGLPVQPEGMESGCIFGSPTLSGEDSDELDDREEEPSLYESLSQSPASACFTQKANHDRFNFGHSCSQYTREPVSDANTGSEILHRENAEFISDSNIKVDCAHAQSGSTENLSPPRAGLPCENLEPQGDLEDESIEYACGGDGSETVSSRSEYISLPPSVTLGLQNLEEAGSPTEEDSLRAAENVIQVSECLSSLRLDMVRLEPIVVNQFSENRRVIDVKETNNQEGSLQIEPIRQKEEDPEEDQYDGSNADNSQPEEDAESSETTSSSSSNCEATSTKESTPAIDDSEVEDGDDQPNRHRVQRSTSLKSGKTPPGTPGRKKIVRFADALGLDLALVRTFLDEVPNVPQSAFSDLSDVNVTEEDNNLLRTTPQTGSYIRITRRDPSTNNTVTTFVNSPRILVASFTQPGNLSDFLEKVKRQKICLETACMMDETKLRGVVRVLNIDFHKSVLIRYTTDEWRTQIDQYATYVPNSCDGLSDRFTFSLNGINTIQPGQRLIFALCYRVAGQELWDSNQGKNYVFQCISNSNYMPSIALSSPAVSDAFLPYF